MRCRLGKQSHFTREAIANTLEGMRRVPRCEVFRSGATWSARSMGLIHVSPNKADCARRTHDVSREIVITAITYLFLDCAFLSEKASAKD
jgi:hypothetical protein